MARSGRRMRWQMVRVGCVRNDGDAGGGGGGASGIVGIVRRTWSQWRLVRWSYAVNQSS